MGRWYPQGRYSPRDIVNEPAWVNSSRGFKKYYLFLCRHSYLTQKSPTHCYTSWTAGQIAKAIGRSKRQVKRYVKYAKDNCLIIRWYAGDSGTTTKTGRPRPPRDELPASKGMIYWWRRIRNQRQKTSRKREEVNHDPKDSIARPGHPRVDSGVCLAPETEALDQGGKSPPGG
ncbi:hypothetical protein ES708_13071 [subsurface metagenome]